MNCLKKYLLFLMTLPLPVVALAQEQATAPASSAWPNPVLSVMTSLIIILLFSILLLAGILRHLAIVYRDKMRKERQQGGHSLKHFGILLLGVLAVTWPESLLAQEGAAKVQAAIGGIPASEFYALTGIILLELLVLISLALLVRNMVRLISRKSLTEAEELAAAEQKALKKKNRVPFWDRFHKAAPLEKEKDIMLGHDYDGIRELDNSLPPWWKYGFYLSILVSVIYMWYYHGGGNGPSSYDEYLAEVQKGEEAKAAYLKNAANMVDENTVTMLEAAAITAGQGLYQTNCAACHANDGGGTVGPNLTDEYWLHGGSIKDIFKSIKYGIPDKGMKSWNEDFSPVQIAQISSYVMTLKGTKPAAPKEPQGTIYEEISIETDTPPTAENSPAP